MAYKEKDTKKWTAQWFETTAKGEKKKRRKRGFETKREAMEFERQKKLNSVKSMDMKLREFIEVYFEDKQNELKDRTIKNKRYMMEQHIILYFGDCMMSEVTAHHIIQWQNEMQTKGFSDSYLRMIQNQLASLFTHASRVYDLHVNPCKKVKRMGNSDSRSLNFWTIDEYRKFIETIEQGTRYYIIFEILFWTGCRIGELLALTKGDVDLFNNQISITKTYYRTGTKEALTDEFERQNQIRSNRESEEELEQYYRDIIAAVGGNGTGSADSNDGERQSIETIITEPEAVPGAEKGMGRKDTDAELRDGTASGEKQSLNKRLARYKEAVEQRERNRQLEGQAHKKTQGRDR